MVSPLVSLWFPLWFSYGSPFGFPMVPPLVFLWFPLLFSDGSPFGFPMVSPLVFLWFPLWFSYGFLFGFPMVLFSLWFSLDCLRISLKSHVLPIECSFDFPMVSQWTPLDFLWFPHGFSMVSSLILL